MKFKLTFLALFTFSIGAFAQSKNSLYIQYGTASNDVNIHGSIGDFGYDGKGGKNFGLIYTRGFSNSWSLVTGVTYSDDKALLNSIQPGRTVYTDVDYKMISVPVLARLTFFKYLFVDGGFLADFETNTQPDNLTSSQSGIGYELGLGVKYSFGAVSVFINPYLQEHAVIRFNNTGSNFNLLDAGFKFGLGYNF